MDVLADLLTRAHARGALFAQTTLAAPWGLAFGPTTPLAFHTLVRGEAWLRRDDADSRDDGAWLHVVPGDLVLVRAPSAHVMSSAPGEPALALEDVVDAWRVGDRRYRAPAAGDGADPGAETVVLCGAYGFEGSLCDTLLAALPPVVHLPAPQSPPLRAALDLIAAELEAAAPGGQTVLDRLLDTVLVFALREHFARSSTPALVRALTDPEVGAALRLLHAEPARAWTVAALAAEVGLSRAALARAASPRSSAARRSSTSPRCGWAWPRSACAGATRSSRPSPRRWATRASSRSPPRSSATTASPPRCGAAGSAPRPSRPERRRAPEGARRTASGSGGPGGDGPYCVLTTIFASPISRPSSRSSMPKVSFSRSAASFLSLTVVPWSTARPSSVVRSGSSVRPSRKNSGAVAAASSPSTVTVPVRTEAPGSMSKSVSSTSCRRR
jgi:hypothetical protein